jgi:hypothetical protein
MYTLKSYRAMLNLCLRANNGSDTSSETPDTPSETPDTPNFEGVVNLLGLPDDAKGELLTILND